MSAPGRFDARELFATLARHDVDYVTIGGIAEHGALDIITLPAHLGPFEDVRTRAHQIPLGDLLVPIAHSDDLLRMKRAAGRPQDLADVQFLESLRED